MIGISKLYCGTVEPSDALRYGRQSKSLPSHLLQFAEDKKPVVVWNVTRACNLKCVHCYAHAKTRGAPDELTTEEGFALIDDLADFGAPVLLFSGGEPLVRPDLTRLIKRTVQKGMRAVISTNGTLITADKANELKDLGLSYVGISLDGLADVNDRFRGVEGAFQQAVNGIKNCRELGLKVGLRFTVNKRNTDEIPAIFDLLEELDVPRICFYHLVYSGRGTSLMNEDPDHEQTRNVVDLIIDRTADLHARGKPTEVLTVDNHADGPYLYLRMLKEGNARTPDVLELLKMNEGNGSGRAIGCVSWDGAVHADQFWRNHTFGHVRERAFSDIWTDPNIELLHQLKDKKQHVTGRCRTCAWLNICAGNFRSRAEAATGDIWGVDPACYLSDDEISGRLGGLG
jgi:Fe-coproporphyrin III synthase